jgi:hypothetical protein
LNTSAIGASPSHLRLNESLTYYFVGDYDLSNVIVQLPGVKYTQMEAVEISPMCASGEQGAMLMVMNVIAYGWTKFKEFIAGHFIL